MEDSDMSDQTVEIKETMVVEESKEVRQDEMQVKVRHQIYM